jgi:cytochrome c biogenesis protein
VESNLLRGPRALWDFFCSLTLTMFLLPALAVTSIIGTVIPQGAVAANYARSIGPARMKLYQALGFFDMYHSWWFILLLGLLCLNLIACSIKRLPQIWRIVTRPQTVLGKSLEKTLPNLATLAVPGEALAVQERLTRILSHEFGSPQVTEQDGVYHLFVQKAPWCRFAVYAVHLSILIILLGAIVGSLFGFKGFANITEGESVTRITSKGEKEIDLGFAVRCEQFRASFYDTGAPKEFKSILTVLENGQPVPGYTRVPIIVNDPLTYKGITFYQSSYGKAGEHVFTASEPDGSHPATFKVASKGSVQLPDGGGLCLLETADDVSSFRPGLSGAAALVELHSADGSSRQTMVFANHPELNRRAQRENGGPLLGYLGGKERMFTGLQVAHDPGVWIVWLGCLLMVIGVYVAFFWSHRRIWAQVSDGKIVIGGNASKNPAGFQLEFDRLLAHIKAELKAKEGK